MIFLRLVIAICPLVFSFAPLRAQDGSGRQAVDLFVSGQDGYAAFRIPAAVITAKGTLLAFAEGRKNSASDNGDIDVVLKRSSDGGKTWSPLTIVSDMSTDAICNPCPVVDRANGRVWLPLIWKAGENSNTQNKRGTGRGSMEVFMTFSDDDGVTWAAPENISAQAKRPEWTWIVTGPGNGIQLASGRLMIPCDHRSKTERSDKASVSHVIFSDDHGKTWTIGGTLDRNTNECQVAQVANGDLLMSIRHHQSPGKLRAFARSTDAGMTWSPSTFHPSVPDPTCQGSILKLGAGGEGSNRLLHSNPSGKGRERMTVRLSEDGGETWPRSLVLHEGPASYSSLVELPAGRAACLFERYPERKKEPIVVVFESFDVSALR